MMAVRERNVTSRFGKFSSQELNEALGIPKLKYHGVRIRLNELEGREIIFKDFFELPISNTGSNRSISDRSRFA